MPATARTISARRGVLQNQPILRRDVRGDARLCNEGAAFHDWHSNVPQDKRAQAKADWHSNVPQDKHVPEEE